MTRTESLAALPMVRKLKERDYLLFSCHVMMDEEEFSMSFQVFKPRQPVWTYGSRPRVCLTDEGFMGVVDDSSGFQVASQSNQNVVNNWK